MKRKLREARGFTLIEMSVVILLLGIIAAFGVPAYVKLNRSLQLKGAVANLAGQLQLARQKAMATGTPQIMHLYASTYEADYHIHNNPSGQPDAKWKFPTNVTYVWSTGTLTGQMVQMNPDGRADRSGMVILQTLGGLRDTVNVQLSGLVLLQ
jgi:prepilin-type N-terminal cleavage/methylation domain-containing protein